jgi:hypothetical protein
MYSNTANSRLAPLGVTLALLVAGGFLLRPLAGRVDALSDPGGLRSEQLTVLAGRGGLLAVLGGMRATVASGFWLKANLAWERREIGATTALIELTVAADERPQYFWLNGARMIAYDMPAWSPAATVPAAVRQRVNEEQARRAVLFLEKGLRWHGADAALYIEMANIYLRRTGDLENAARCYRLAAQQPGAPYYAARIHGELLREMGHTREALDWLRQQLPNLPADDPAARRDVVLARIQALELELAGR